MAVLNRKSVGDVTYILIDDLYPVFTGETGDVVISKNGDVFTCDGGYIWSTYNRNNLESEIYSYNNNDTTLAPTLGTWTIPGIGATTPFTAATNSSGFTNSGLTTTTPAVQLRFNNVGRFLTITNNSLRAEVGQWNQVDWAPAKNNTTPLRYNSAHFGTDPQNDATNIYTPVLYELDSRANDFMFMSYRVRARETATAYFDRVHTKLSTALIEKPITFIENGFPSDFNVNGWTTVNDTTNQWFMGTATSFSGGGTSIYISNNGGVSNQYTNTVAQVSHFYKDFTFPNNLQSDVVLSFFWKCQGESGFDYGRVFLTPNTTIPVAGSQISITFRIGLSEYNLSSTYQSARIVIPRNEVIGQTKRLIFSWANDNSVGPNPPMVIDSLRMYYYVNDNAYQFVSGDTETFSLGSFSANTWTTVNNPTTNFWIVGNSEFSGTNDTFSAYITTVNNTNYYGSNFNGGINISPAQYSTTNATVSHFYKDFTLTSASTLTFNWKCWGENFAGTATAYDYGTVNIIATTTTPVSGTEVATALAAAGGNGRIGATTNQGKFNEGYGGPDNNWRTETINLASYSGQTKRLVFSFKTDTSIGDNPPFVVDNIRITGAGNWARSIQKLN